MTQEDEIALNVLKKMPGFIDVLHRSTFWCHRRTKSGADQVVTVEILDAGPGKSPRFWVSAKSDDGKEASGNAQDTLNNALALVHWYQLD